MNPAQSLLIALKRCNWVADEDVEGCTLAEIKEIEQAFHVQLPTAYKDFLFLMGKGAGEFRDDQRWTYSELRQARASADRLLRDAVKAGHTTFELTSNIFVFCEGVEETIEDEHWFAFFELDSGEDPPVYTFLYVNESVEPEITADSFSRWLLDFEEQALEVKAFDDQSE